MKRDNESERKEPIIYYEWKDSTKKDLKICGLSKLIDKVGSKPLWMFLAGLKTTNPRLHSLLVIAKLFNAITPDEFEKLTTEEREKLIRSYEENLPRSDWRYWRNAAEREQNLGIRIKRYQEGLDELENHPKLILQITTVFWHANKPDEAKEYFLKGLELYPKDADIHSNFGLFLQYALKDDDEAEKHFKIAYRLSPKHINNSIHYAWFLHGVREDFKNAEKYYGIALKVNPNCFAPLHNYGLLLCFDRFDMKKGIEQLKKARNIDPENAYAQGSLANAYTTYGINLDEAEGLYRKAIAKEPTNAIKLTNFTQLLFVMGKYDEAMDYMQLSKQYAVANDLVIELEFYLYAHSSQFRNIAAQNIDKMLSEGKRSYRKNFTVNIKAAIRQGHPSVKELISYASRISKMKYTKTGELVIPKKPPRKPSTKD